MDSDNKHATTKTLVKRMLMIGLAGGVCRSENLQAHDAREKAESTVEDIRLEGIAPDLSRGNLSLKWLQDSSGQSAPYPGHVLQVMATKLTDDSRMPGNTTHISQLSPIQLWRA